MTLTLDDGRTVHGHVDRSPGSEDAPLGVAALRAKFAGNVGTGSERLAAALAALPDARDLAELLAATVLPESAESP